MNNIPNIKKKYIKPELVAVAIDQEITLVMVSEGPDPWENESTGSSGASSQIFGPTEVGNNSINWDSVSKD